MRSIRAVPPSFSLRRSQILQPGQIRLSGTDSPEKRRACVRVLQGDGEHYRVGPRGQHLKGETSVAEAGRIHGLAVADVEDWREKFLLGAENALRSRPWDEERSRMSKLSRGWIHVMDCGCPVAKPMRGEGDYLVPPRSSSSITS